MPSTLEAGDVIEADHSDSVNLETPTSLQVHESRLYRKNYDDSAQPKRSRLLSDVYEETEEVELEEDLFLMGIDKPFNYKQAAKDKNWN